MESKEAASTSRTPTLSLQKARSANDCAQDLYFLGSSQPKKLKIKNPHDLSQSDEETTLRRDISHDKDMVKPSMMMANIQPETHNKS